MVITAKKEGTVALKKCVHMFLMVIAVTGIMFILTTADQSAHAVQPNVELNCSDGCGSSDDQTSNECDIPDEDDQDTDSDQANGDNCDDSEDNQEEDSNDNDDGEEEDSDDDGEEDDDNDQTPDGGGICNADSGQLFGPDHPWNQPIDLAALDTDSNTIINFLQTNHQENPDYDDTRFKFDGPSEQVDSLYGMTILYADDTTPHQTFEPTDDFYTPHCDPAPIPIPQIGAIEGEQGFSCTNNGDCHLIVIDTDECRLFEMWRADINEVAFNGGCLAVWDLNQSYTETLRGDHCTSADAAGLPIAPLMFTADEIDAGEIKHAIRFILPNHLIRYNTYVRPSTHNPPLDAEDRGPNEAPPYGARLRLKTSNEVEDVIQSVGPAAQVVLRALQKYCKNMV
jgi:serine/threonine-protein kinase